MKWLLYILSCYILLLSCIPCTDNNAVSSSPGVPVAQLTTSHNHESQPDFCSPLCVCSCCNVQVTPHTPVIVYFYMQQVIVDYPVLPVNPLPSSSDNIWQPPQLV
ncbi:DUF6660 family protein [Chitinophaga sp.]|uniref:DUF6660 family protein n=1 Tax=Chitinophaga sp. TaxID=1869181 RepID=UPI002F937C10